MRSAMLVRVVAVALWASVGAEPARTQEAPGPGRTNSQPAAILLLRNGQILQGKITQLGDRYQVLVAGGEIQVKNSEVQCVCQRVEEVYAHRRAVIRLDSAQEHLELAQWCLKLGLTGPAKAELADAVTLDPSHPLIPLVERRMQYAQGPQPSASTEGRQVSHGPTSEELDRMVRGMPPKTVEIFARSIQPMLMNSCAGAGCHGQPSGKGLQLFRVAPGGPSSPRVTQRNLYATLQCIDFDNPESSRILKAPIGPHGTARSAIFTNRQLPQYKQLIDWCYRVAQVPSPVVQASYDEPVGEDPPAHVGARPANRLRRSASARTPPKGPSLAATPETEPEEPLLESRGDVPVARRPSVRRAQPSAQGQTDPFDPDLFNRRFAPSPRGAVEQERPEEPSSSDSPETLFPARANLPADGGLPE